jgi:hypothetical protein
MGSATRRGEEKGTSFEPLDAMKTFLATVQKSE